jgi:hypothetical protein
MREWRYLAFHVYGYVCAQDVKCGNSIYCIYIVWLSQVLGHTFPQNLIVMIVQWMLDLAEIDENLWYVPFFSDVGCIFVQWKVLCWEANSTAVFIP